jgi:NNP family nitrate/nitrite transporter-like MFS transporter
MAAIEKWDVEDPGFWEETGSKIAWRTLAITTFSLLLSFSTWFVMSAIVVRLPQIGFNFDKMQLFWLAAMPGLAGGTLRLVHMFLIPIFGTRQVITWATLLKLIPCVGIGMAVMDPTTPFWVFILLALTAGFGGGDFSSYMPSTSLFFPKRLQGTALGIQAGIGNFGVSLTQFVTPWIITVGSLGVVTGASQTFTKGEISKPIWIQNAVFWYIPLLIIIAIVAALYLKRVPVKTRFVDQLDIFKEKHTWNMTILYVMTFGSFAGLSAAFPLMIKTIYGCFPDCPDALKYAFYGPLIGSLVRVLFGPISDMGKRAGSIITAISGAGLIVCGVALIPYLNPTSLDQFPYFVGLMLGMFFFAGIGNASTFRQIPVIFSHNPRQGAGVIGWTAAIAAYGPFVFTILIGKSIEGYNTASPFFYGAIVFYAIAFIVNYWYYLRANAEKPC